MADYHAFDLVADFYVRAPITFEMMRALAENPIAIAEGASGAPRLQTGIIAVGGSIADGVFDNTFAPSKPGYYDVSGGTRSSSLSLPRYSFVRVRGDLVLSSTLTVDQVSPSESTILERIFNCWRGIPGEDGDSEGAGGGGGWGNGGNGDAGGSPAIGGGGFNPGNLSNAWPAYIRRAFIGGIGGRPSSPPANGGGALILMIDGDLDMSGGGIIEADGAAGSDSNANTGGGGGGGSIIVVCSGTVTDGNFRARGGPGGVAAHGSSGGGGGGHVVVVADTFAGVQTYTVTGGGHTNSGSETSTSGSAGTSDAVDLPESFINGLYWR
jgi:hypothetical protein